VRWQLQASIIRDNDNVNFVIITFAWFEKELFLIFTFAFVALVSYNYQRVRTKHLAKAKQAILMN
jgi:hypothetical protein